MDPRQGSTSSSNFHNKSKNLTSTYIPNKYELQNAVQELFQLFYVNEGKHFNRETISERFEKSIGRQSSKPFSLFYNRLADNEAFLEKYQKIKCQNSSEIDPFVRFLVRVREDKNMNNFLNNYDTTNQKIKSINNESKSHNTQSNILLRKSKTSLTSSSKARPTSALLNMASIKQTESNASLIKSNSTHMMTNNTLRSSSATNRIQSSKINNSSNLISPNKNQSDNDMKSLDTNYQSRRKVPPHFSLDFHPCDWPKENDCFNTLGSHSVQEQEQLLLRDLLFVLIGIEGRYIRLNKSNDLNHYKLVLDPTTDHFLSVTTNRILKICPSYSIIITFIESNVYGLVNQALVAAIHQHINDYNLTICQMEESLLKNDFFLQKMFYILLPYFSTFSLLREICAKLFKNKSVGGTVLTLLHEKTKSIQGMDNNALDLCLNLTKSAAIPYFDIMKTWIYYGEIGDPRKEFFIEDTHNHTNSVMNGTSDPLNISQKNYDIESDEDEYDDDFGKFDDKYWDVRYKINPSKTPCFLKKYEQTIYKTGKYVSIINKVKQKLMKSSKVIPIPQSLNQCPGINIVSTETTSKAPPTTTYGSNNLFFCSNNVYSMNNPPTTIADNSSFASLASSSSSNTSHSTGGGLHAPSFLTTAIFTPKPEEIYYSFDESTYITPIVSAYEEASSQLLHILINESQLVETFNAVKHFMLLSMGDFIVHFIKFASNDLCKRTDSVVQHRLDSMMGMALGISVCHSDRQYLKDDPHIEFVGKSFLKEIYQIMKPFNNNDNNNWSSFKTNDPSPLSSYLLKEDDDAIDDDDEEVALNRSIISSVIEADDESQNGSINAKSHSNNYFKKNRNKIVESALQNLNEQDNILGNKNNSSIQRKLFCYESLMLKFDVPFPLSLIFSQKSILCYELLFRYVFLCRYAEMELEETWKDNILNVQLMRCDTISLLNHLTLDSKTCEAEARILKKTFKSIHKKAFALRYKMIAFVRNFHYFYAFEVIDPFFAQFISQITKRGSSLDSVIECHEKFLEHCFSSCFLTSMEITTIIIKIFTLCIELSQALKDSIGEEDHLSIMENSCFFGYNEIETVEKNKVNLVEKQPHLSDKDGDKVNDKLNQIYFNNRNFSVAKIIDKANAEFDKLVSQLLKKIYSDNCEYHIMYPFVARLDYNDFYRSQILE